jgi:hypothetical protein
VPVQQKGTCGSEGASYPAQLWLCVHASSSSIWITIVTSPDKSGFCF